MNPMRYEMKALRSQWKCIQRFVRKGRACSSRSFLRTVTFRQTMFILLFLINGLLASSFALEDEGQGDGPFTQPLEPGLGEMAFSANANSELQGYKVIRVVPQNSDQLGFLRVLLNQNNKIFDIDFWKEPVRVGSPVDMMLSSKDMEFISRYLRANSLQYSLMIDNVEARVMTENERHSGTLFSTYTGFDYGRYHTLNEIHNEIENLANRYANAKVFSLGNSYERRPMKAIKITGKQRRNKKAYFFNCAIHAREWITAATCMYMINQMLTLYGKDASVTAMLDKMDWIVLPVFNVDGYKYTWNGGRARMWRKTRSRGSSYRCLGADPNRNWDYKWGGVGTSSYECAETYRGKGAFSEIEVKTVANYLSRHKNSLAGYMDIHAYSQLWMTPWGYTTLYPKDYLEMIRVAKAAVGALRSIYGTYYRAGASSRVIYATSGGSADWTYGKLGLVYSYALELRDRGQYGFLLPAWQIIPTGRETFAAMKKMAAMMRV